MTESTTHNVTELKKPSLKTRLFTKQNLKRGAILGTVLAVAVWLKSKINGSASGNVDVHVETTETDNN